MINKTNTYLVILFFSLLFIQCFSTASLLSSNKLNEKTFDDYYSINNDNYLLNLNSFNSTNSDIKNSYFKQINTIDGYYPIAVTNDNRYLILTMLQPNSIGSYTNITKLYDLKTNQFIKTFSDQYSSLGDLNSGSISSDNSILAVTDSKGILQVWDITSGSILRQIFLTTQVYNTKFLPNSPLLVGTTISNALRIWNTSTYGTYLYSATKHSSSINTLSVSPNGTFLVTGGNDKNIILWNISNITNITARTVHQTNSTIVSSTFSNDNNYLLVADYSNIFVFDMNDNCSLINLLPNPSTPYAINKIAMIPNSSMLIVVTADGHITLINLSTMQKFYQFIPSVESSFYTMIVSPDSIYAGQNTQSVFINRFHYSVPTAPSNLEISYIEGKANLSWIAPNNTGGYDVSYNIYRSKENESNFNLLAQRSNTNFVDSNILLNTNYFYKVSASNILGGGSFSNVVSLFISASTTVDNTQSSQTIINTTSGNNTSTTSVASSYDLIILILCFTIAILFKKKRF